MSRIFIDMDGTLARFHDEAAYLERMYEPGFFRGLHPFSDFLLAVNFSLFTGGLNKKDVYILSSVIESPTCETEKREWLKKYMPDFTEEQQIFCPMGVPKAELVPKGINPDDILIDDYNKNLEEWRAAGGLAVKFVNNINDKGRFGTLWDEQRIYFNKDWHTLADEICDLSHQAEKIRNKKIERNNVEDKKFLQQMSAYMAGSLPSNEVIRIGTTPYCLRAVGADAVPLIVTQSVIQNSLENIDVVSNNTRKRHSKQHDIQVEIIKMLPQVIRNPILICKGNNQECVVVVSRYKDKDNHNIIIPVYLNVKGKNCRVNRVASIYGKTNIKAYLEYMKEKAGILAINKTEADKLFSDIGCQLPKSTTIICFDNSIAYSDKSVEYPKEKICLEPQTNTDKNKKAIQRR